MFVFVSEKMVEIIDNGVGLNEKPRGYEGFGIGLQIVNDICQRYQCNLVSTTMLMVAAQQEYCFNSSCARSFVLSGQSPDLNPFIEMKTLTLLYYNNRV